MLVFWETTRACQLACRHCRASAQPRALPGELSRDEGYQLIDQVAGFGRPYPILILTGGDCLLRPDLFELIGYARSAGIPVALSPSVTPALSPAMIGRIADSGVKAVSVSLDGAGPATHDGVRGIGGHFHQTIGAIRALVAAGLSVQVNTTVMDANVAELASVAGLLDRLSVHAWEVFFLVQTGRGTAEGAVTPGEHEDVCHFLYDASRHGFVVRTVEAPFFRRVVTARRAGDPPPDRPLYTELSAGPPAGHPGRAAPRAHRGHPGRQGHRLHRAQRGCLSRGFPAAHARQRAPSAARPDLPGGSAADRHPGGQVRRALRAVCLRRSVRGIAGTRLRGHVRPAGRGPGLPVPALKVRPRHPAHNDGWRPGQPQAPAPDG
jgi:MoaA/NifB/PqqE/SkfB family radical SAM enzyme